MVIDGDHHRRLGAGVDVLWRLRAAELTGTVIEGRHAEIQGQAGLAAKTRDGADLAGRFGAADRAVARDGGELAGDGGTLGAARHLLFQGLDLPFQLEDSSRILLDHVADQAGIGSEVGAALPSLDGIGVGGADAGHFEQAGAAHPGQLEQSLATGQKVQEPQVADFPGNLQKPWADGRKVGLAGRWQPVPVR